jgi:hypothetical protein
MRDSDTLITGVPELYAVPIPHDAQCITTQGNGKCPVNVVKEVKGTGRDCHNANRSCAICGIYIA